MEGGCHSREIILLPDNYTVITSSHATTTGGHILLFLSQNVAGATIGHRNNLKLFCYHHQLKHLLLNIEQLAAALCSTEEQLSMAVEMVKDAWTEVGDHP